MNAKLLLVCLAVMLMAATESANVFAKRALRKRQENTPDMSDEELDKFEQIVALLKQMAIASPKSNRCRVKAGKRKAYGQRGAIFHCKTTSRTFDSTANHQKGW